MRGSRARGIFHPQQVERLIREHTRGLRDHALQLWQILTLELCRSGSSSTPRPPRRPPPPVPSPSSPLPLSGCEIVRAAVVEMDAVSRSQSAFPAADPPPAEVRRPPAGERGPRVVLDAGCGNGSLAWQAYKLGNRVIGVSIKDEVARNRRLFNEFHGIREGRLSFRDLNLYDI